MTERRYVMDPGRATIIASVIAVGGSAGVWALGYFFPPKPSTESRTVTEVLVDGVSVLRDAFTGKAGSGVQTTARIGQAVVLQCGVIASVQAYTPESGKARVIVDGTSRGLDKGGETYRVKLKDGKKCVVGYMGLTDPTAKPPDYTFGFRCDC
jgi:hypothetical protein